MRGCLELHPEESALSALHVNAGKGLFSPCGMCRKTRGTTTTNDYLRRPVYLELSRRPSVGEMPGAGGRARPALSHELRRGASEKTPPDDESRKEARRQGPCDSVGRTPALLLEETIAPQLSSVVKGADEGAGA